jgi:hypothetical protein
MGDDDGALRALRAEARRDERRRILDTLADTAAEYERRAAPSRRPAVTGWGRQAAGLRRAAELIEAPMNGHWSDPDVVGNTAAWIANDCDSVELYTHDPWPLDELTPEQEPYPVRIVVVDGGDDTRASAYLSVDDAAEVVDQLGRLVENVRRARAERQTQPAADHG